MGLDQSFYVRRPINNYEYLPDEEKEAVVLMRGGKPIPASEFDVSRVEYLHLNYGYLRKANQIHNWIDREVDGGVENCQPTILSRQQMEKLLSTIKLVLKNSVLVNAKIVVGYRYIDGAETPMMEDGQTIKDPTVAQEHLPTTTGFFFGSQDYDQFYIQDLQEAKRICEAILADESNEIVMYEPWW